MAIPVVTRTRSGVAFSMALAGSALSTAASAWALAEVLANGSLRYDLGGWAPPVGIQYVVDEVSAFVALVVTSVTTLAIAATRRWAEREAAGRAGPFYALVMLLVAGLTGMVVTADLFNLFVFLEISSLAAYTLVFLGGRAGMLAGFRYLVLGTIGGVFYLLGVGFLYFSTGTLNMEETAAILAASQSSRSVQAGAVFIFVGLGLKMALVPLHLWLPDAYTHAPSSVNSLLAPVMTKVGAYAMVRMFLSVFPPGYLKDEALVADGLLVLGLAGIVYGSVAAMRQPDIRRMLAYSSIGQLGLIAVGIGLATPLGLVAALLHVMNHAVMKGTLFLAAASVRLSTGLSNVRDLTGLGRAMPLTMACFTLGALSMVGIPPSAGFFSKWWAAQAGVESGQWAVVVVVLGSTLLTAIYVFIVLERVYLRPPQPPPPGHEASDAAAAPGDETGDAPDALGERALAQASGAAESPADVVLPLAVLALATVGLGLANSFIVTHVLEPGVR